MKSFNDIVNVVKRSLTRKKFLTNVNCHPSSPSTVPRAVLPSGWPPISTPLAPQPPLGRGGSLRRGVLSPSTVGRPALLLPSCPPAWLVCVVTALKSGTPPPAPCLALHESSVTDTAATPPPPTRSLTRTVARPGGGGVGEEEWQRPLLLLPTGPTHRGVRVPPTRGPAVVILLRRRRGGSGGRRGRLGAAQRLAPRPLCARWRPVAAVGRGRRWRRAGGGREPRRRRQRRRRLRRRRRRRWGWAASGPCHLPPGRPCSAWRPAEGVRRIE